jgi:hypothetical protein
MSSFLGGRRPNDIEFCLDGHILNMMSVADWNSFIEIHGRSVSTGAIGETSDGIVIDRSREPERRRPKGIAIELSPLYRLPICFLRLTVLSGDSTQGDNLFIRRKASQYITPSVSQLRTPIGLLARSRKLNAGAVKIPRAAIFGRTDSIHHAKRHRPVLGLSGSVLSAVPQQCSTFLAA